MKNVVAFPTNGQGPKFTGAEDPVEELLHEFDNLADSDDWEDIEDQVGETTVEMVLGEDFLKSAGLVQMLEQLNEVQKRTEHFSKEIETFLPKKGR